MYNHVGYNGTQALDPMNLIRPSNSRVIVWHEVLTQNGNIFLERRMAR